jgi:transposase
MSVAPLPDLHTLDAAALRDMVIQQHAQIASRDAELDRLRLVIARLRRMQFGRKSEKIERQIEQLELQLEDLEARTGQEQQQTENTLRPAASAVFATATRKPVRRSLPEHLPREVEIHEPQHEGCPACGAALSKLGSIQSITIAPDIPSRAC